MGSSVVARFGEEDGICTHFLNGPLSSFEAWAWSLAEEYPNHVGLDVLIVIDAVKREGASALLATDAASAATVDEMVRLHYGEFTTHRGRLSRAAFSSYLSERSCRSAITELLAREPNGVLVEPWRSLLDGRAVARDAHALPYASDSSFRVGYWTFLECVALRSELERFARQSALGEVKDAIRTIAGATAAAVEKQVGLIFCTG